MRALIVDDEPLMIRSFMRLSEGIPDFTVVGQLNNGADAVRFVSENEVEIVFLDIVMPGITGIEAAKRIKEIRPDILIVFISAFGEYVHESNMVGGDYYIVKPYKREVLEMTVSRMKFLQKRQEKHVVIQTFGRFSVLLDGKPINLSGKAKEILALIVTRRGKEISNEELYSTIWEDRPYGNIEMKVYYNALQRLKRHLSEDGLSELLISSARGQRINTEMVDCDYYNLLDSNMSDRSSFEGEFLPEYSWGEYILGDIIERYSYMDKNG